MTGAHPPRGPAIFLTASLLSIPELKHPPASPLIIILMDGVRDNNLPTK